MVAQAEYSRIFEPCRIGTLELKNRIVLPPMGTGYSEGRKIWRRILDYYEARAKGGAGLIITEGVAPSPRCQGPRQLSLGDDEDLAGWRELVRVVHRHGAKLAVQLHHAGYEHRKGSFVQVAPSALRVPGRMIGVSGVLPLELTEEEVQDIVRWHADAARRAKEVGIDAVEIHAAHQYLIASFLSPASNKRTDRYGGGPEGRARLLVEVLEAMRSAVGADYPIWPRINVCEYGVEGGGTVEETRKWLPLLVQSGAQAVHASAYAAFSFITKAPLPDGTAFLAPLAEEVKKTVGVPVIAVGRLDLSSGEEILKEGRADLIAIGRRLIADPDLPKKCAEGREEEVRPCIGCYECIEGLSTSKEGLYCTVNPTTGREGEWKVQRGVTGKKVWVIGGGPAGLEAARVAAERGHRVTLIEKREKLGGLLPLAALPPNKGDLLPWRDYLIRQAEKAGVEFLLRTEATAEMIRNGGADVLILATGGLPLLPDFPGTDRSFVAFAQDVLSGKVQVGQRVVVVGGGLVGCEAAHYLAVKGKQVTVVEMEKRTAKDIGPMVRRRLMDGLKAHRVSLMTETKVEEIVEGGVTVAAADGRRNTFPTDTVVLAVGFRPDDRLFKALEGQGPKLYRVGDCLQPRGFREAVQEGFLAALSV